MNTENTQNRTWIIRYPDLKFSRPIPETELLKMFSGGEMKPHDEICPATGYWFSLQDVKEMRKHFGNMPLDGLFKKVNDEVTQERYAVTAPISLPKDIKAALRATPAPVMHTSTAPASSGHHSTAPEESSIQKASPLVKMLLAALTLLVLVLLFVWFG